MTKTDPRVPTSTPPSSSTRWALAAAAGLCLAGCNQSGDKPTGEKAAASSPTSDKACCHGKNACKGKGGCAVAGKNDCSGKNACKGQGGCNMHCPK